MVTFTPIQEKKTGVAFAPLTSQPKISETPTVNQKPWEDRAIGVAQSGLGLATGTARGLQEFGLGIMGLFGADREDYGLKSLKAETKEGKAVTSALTPKTAEQAQGKLAGDIAQYIAPASKVMKATQNLPTLTRLFARVAPDIMTSLAQNLGADTGELRDLKPYGVDLFRVDPCT
jgi:hypothetical protein